MTKKIHPLVPFTFIQRFQEPYHGGIAGNRLKLGRLQYFANHHVMDSLPYVLEYNFTCTGLEADKIS